MRSSTIINDSSESRDFLDVLQSAVVKQYSNPYDKNEPIIYEFTQDKAMLHQYYDLRNRLYRKIYKSQKNFAENIHDKISHILIARRGNMCLGGCRLTVREADEMWPLPMESKELKLRDVIHDLPLDRESHAENSGFVVLEDCGSEDVAFELCRMVRNKLTSLRVKYLFTKSTYLLARNWSLIGAKLYLKTKIYQDVHVPSPIEHKDEDWKITFFDFSHLYKSGSADEPKNTYYKDHAIALVK